VSPVATPTARQSADATSRPRLIETDVLIVHSDDPLTVARLLRRLEVLRRRLAVRWCGVDGAFAGYDRLTVGDLSGIVDGTVGLEARLVDADETSHVIELVATRSPGRTGNGQALLHGTGRALQTRSTA
jgi:hypothetical protein